jgi:hypothetical protein
MDMLRTSWVEAARVALAAEELIRARPALNGACAGIDRPRVMIWGIAPWDEGHNLRWLDWTLDDVGVQGGDATAQAEARLWQGAIAAALEKEAVLRLAQSTDEIPLDLETPVQDPGRFGPEGQADAARGYLTLATGPEPRFWWRLDPATGRADARVAGLGNAWERAVNFWRMGVSGMSEGQMATLPAAETAEMEAIFEQSVAAVERVNPNSLPRENCFDKEGYLTLLCNVSIPASIALGSMVVMTELAIIYALYAD